MKFVPCTRQNRRARWSVLLSLSIGTFALTLMSHHNGVAEEQNKDRTGAPGSSQPCSACHSSGSYTVTPSITAYAFEGSETPVTEFTPNTEYYIVFEVGSSDNPEGYGFQATAVFGNGDNAGTFIACSDNAQLEDVGGRHIVEQNDISASNTFSLYWGAPAGGEGDVTFYASMLAANGAYGNTGDSYAGTSLTLSEAVTGINCPDCWGDRDPIRMWATGDFLNIVCDSDASLDAFAVDGRWLKTLQLSAGKHTLSTRNWGVRGLVIGQLSYRSQNDETKFITQRFWAD